MKKHVDYWTVDALRQQFGQMEFPEYQREPNLWSLVEKQRLIDSMVRQFDIASLYFYQYNDGSIDCVDGRQRIGSIMSFLGINSDDPDDKFPLRRINEIYDDVSLSVQSIEGKRFFEIEKMAEERNDPVAQRFVKQLLEYRLTIVKLSDSNDPGEFNLQFTRLNLGTIINSGEKLHAMMGALRNKCFAEFGKHPFLAGTNIPIRRYAQEQVAAQIVAQIFSLDESGNYTRTRHLDLQRLFKIHSVLDDVRAETLRKLTGLFDLLSAAFQPVSILRNRAITVSTTLLAWESRIETAEQASELANFVDEFVHRLRWQVKMGLDADREYRYLIEFQRNITQASAERYSVETRAEVLKDGLRRWRNSRELRGDTEWVMRNPGSDPSEVSRR